MLQWNTVTQNTPLLMEGLLGGGAGGGGPCAKTEVNNLPLPGPQREARLQWKTSLGFPSQAGPAEHLSPGFVQILLGSFGPTASSLSPLHLSLALPQCLSSLCGPASLSLTLLHPSSQCSMHPRSLFLCCSWHLLGHSPFPWFPPPPVCIQLQARLLCQTPRSFLWAPLRAFISTVIGLLIG